MAMYGDKLSYVLFSWWIFFAGIFVAKKQKTQKQEHLLSESSGWAANSTCKSNMCHNHGGVNFVNQKPENGKLSSRANSENRPLVFWRIPTHTPFCLTQKKRQASSCENDRTKRRKINKWWNIQFQSESFQQESGTTFSEIRSSFPEIFQWNAPQSRVSLTHQSEFLEI